MFFQSFSLHRIIPTRMGTRIENRGITIHSEDHPHAYGDKAYYTVYLSNTQGSSPRVWGQGQKRLKQVILRGIIPTRMGTRTAQGAVIATRKDHPHAYGDKFNNYIRVFLLRGSSPRVWGQVECIARKYTGHRIIPTRMGTRSDSIGKLSCEQDHPHAYGDKL